MCSDKAVELDSPPSQPSESGSFNFIEAGDMGREMGKEYIKQLNDLRISHANLKGFYYILVNHFQQLTRPDAHYLCFCSTREKPRAERGTDLWKVNNQTDELELIWTLPHRESWKQLKYDIHSDPFLLKCMEQFEKGEI